MFVPATVQDHQETIARETAATVLPTVLHMGLIPEMLIGRETTLPDIVIATANQSDPALHQGIRTYITTIITTTHIVRVTTQQTAAQAHSAQGHQVASVAAAPAVSVAEEEDADVIDIRQRDCDFQI